jgi:hypothetical protein
MPKYKDKSRFFTTNDKRFDDLFEPGQEAPFDAIYVCITCGFEVYAEKGTELPSYSMCDEHADNLDWCSQGTVTWRPLAALVNRQR